MPSGTTSIAGAGGTPNCTPATGGGPAASAGGPASCSSGGGPAGGGASCTDGMWHTGGLDWIVVDELDDEIAGGGLLALGACACC